MPTQEEIKTNNYLNGNNIPVSAITPIQPLNLGTPVLEDLSGLSGTANEALNYVNNLTTQQNTAQENVNTSQTGITDTMNSLLGITADTQAANQSSGLNAATIQLNNLNAQAQSLNREALAIPIQTQQRNANTGATDRGVAPQTAGALRENALKALSIAQQADVATSNYTAAKDKAQQIIDLKYKPLEAMLAIKKQQYEFNKDILSSVDKKRTEALGIALKKQEQELADKKDNEKKVEDAKIKSKELAFNLQKNGAPQSIIDKALAAKSIEEIQKIAGVSAFLKTQDELLDERLKETQIKKINFDMAETRAKRIVDEKATTPTQQKKIDEDLKAKTVRKAQLIPLKQKIDLIKEIKQNKGLAASVGPKGNPFAKLAWDYDLFTGVRADFAASVQQLTNQETLSELLALKAAGGTLGAVSEKELDLLQKAASKINAWEVKDKNGIGKGTWDISEKLFNEELDKLLTASQNLYTSLGGNEAGSPEDVKNADEYMNIVDEMFLGTDAVYSSSGYDLK